MTIFIATLASVVTIALGTAALVRWIYRRGQASGRQQAALEREKLAQATAQAEAKDKVKALAARVAQIQDDAQSKVRALEGQVTRIQAELDLIRAQQAKVLSP